MSSSRATVKKIIPPALWKPVSDSYWWWRNRGRHQAAQILSSQWQENLALLRLYKDQFKGQRCFIIGNGPSLRNTNLTLLKDEHTFGLNRIYLIFPELGFQTRYLVSVNDLVLEQCAAEMSQLNILKFVTWRARRWFKKDPQARFIDSDFTGPENFTGDLSGRIFEGFTVTYAALQIAFYMGYSEAVLVGVDHNFQTKGPSNSTVTSQGDDPNHFAPNYFGAGFRWQLPDLEGSERAYTLARHAYEAAGRSIVDATVGGKLTVFPKVDYNSLFPR